MTTVLKNADVEKVIDMGECMAALEDTYKDLQLQRGINRPRNHTYFPVKSPNHPDFGYRFKSQEGGTVSAGVWALRITSDMTGVEKMVDGSFRRRLLPVATGNRYVGFIVLFDLERLEPIAIIDDSVIQKYRVAATSALGIRRLAPQDAEVAGLFGAGWQASAHLDALLRIRPGIREVRVFSPTPDHRRRFAAEQSAKHECKVLAVDAPEQAVKGCQIVTAATAAMEPVLDGRWLEPGQHITCINSPDGTAMRRELDDEAYARADYVLVLSKEQIEHDNQVDLKGAIAKGKPVHELGELLLDMAPGRTDSKQITIFANNTGMGVQFAAVGARVLELAKKAGLGREIATELFLEETTP
ncbi:MAG: ornithine cyclodeaminase family protein [Chloroflexota bacterium]|nr:ornithine cyclodeaminase family protein [Chloroflexota bacterium]